MSTINQRYQPQEGALPMQGGMSSVFLCTDSILERPVALKVMKQVADQRRLFDELTALLQLRSKHVVQIFDVLIENPTEIVLVLEYIDGTDLFETAYLNLNLDEFLRLLWQLASGISDIHSLNLIHRDIKPNNVKIDNEGILKIFDFGLSRAEGDSASTMGFVGTPGFAAPELFASNVTFDKAIDVYAFGISALHLLDGSLPTQLLAKPPTFTASVFSNCNRFELAPEIINLLTKCLSTDPKARPSIQSVRDMLARHLLKDKHRALFVFQGNHNRLDSTHPSVSLDLPGVASLKIRYTGLDFEVAELTGTAYINNAPASLGFKLPGSCVVTLGGPELTNNRRYVTFDVSYPEVIC